MPEITLSPGEAREWISDTARFALKATGTSPEAAKECTSAAVADEEAKRSAYERMKAEFDAFTGGLSHVSAELRAIRNAQATQADTDCRRALETTQDGRTKLAREIAGRDATRMLLEQTERHAQTVLQPKLNLELMRGQAEHFESVALIAAYKALEQGIAAYRASEALRQVEGGTVLFTPNVGHTSALIDEAVRLFKVAADARSWLRQEEERQARKGMK